jgi:hypothetical protein
MRNIIETRVLSAGWMFIQYASKYLVSYYVTVLALVDQALLVLFFLWEHDHYLVDDREIHELSFLFSNSLYDIRIRSESLMASCESFLHPNSGRLTWIRRIETLMHAFRCEHTVLCFAMSHALYDRLPR